MKSFLVSVLVQDSKQMNHVGHRASIEHAETMAEALGKALISFQVDKWVVTSHDIAEITTMKMIDDGPDSL